ncbi:MAG: hypothetical protein RL318_491 [Fibrobacterota bacterium]|jgi:hypothetical protein
MRKPARFLIAFTFLFLLFGASSAQAKGVPLFYSSGTEKIVKGAEFPDTDDFRTQSGEYIDAGYKFKQVQLFWIPLWNYGGEWCGYIGKDDAFIEIPKPALDSMATVAKVTLPAAPSLGIWNSYSGKAIIGLLLLGILAIVLMPAGKDD